MAQLEVLRFPDPRLKQRSQEVTRFDDELRTLAENMLETMYAEEGIGLAAPQVGELRRLIVIDVRDGEGETEEERRNPWALCNPRVLSAEGEIVTEEGCLSVPEFTAEVKRASSVRVAYETLQGETRETDLQEIAAVCLQHESDHLDGRLFIDHLPPLKQQMVKKRLTKQARRTA